MAARLYEADLLVDRAPLLTRPGWLPPQPVDLDQIDIEWIEGPQPQPIDGTEPQAQLLCPLRCPGQCYDRYTSAIRYLDPPALFENRPSYRLLGVSWPTPGRGQLRFGLANYFDKLDVSEAIGHELAAAWLHTQAGTPCQDGPLASATVSGLAGRSVRHGSTRGHPGGHDPDPAAAKGRRHGGVPAALA